MNAAAEQGITEDMFEIDDPDIQEYYETIENEMDEDAVGASREE
jgi:hypothetical protein